MPRGRVRVLSPEEVDKVLDMRRTGRAQSRIARLMGVSTATISRICRGTYYRKQSLVPLLSPPSPPSLSWFDRLLVSLWGAVSGA